MTEAVENTAARYLLGRMDEAEREAFEIRYLGDPELSETVAAVESDLLDDYLSGALPHDEREAVERNLLTTPEQKKRLATARALRIAFARSRPRAAGTWWKVAIAAALAAIATTALLVSIRRGDVTPAKPAQVVRTPMTTAPSATAPPAPSTATTAIAQDDPVVVTIVLSAVMTRGVDEDPATTIPVDAEAVRIVIGLQPGDDEFARYDVLLQTPGGEPLLASRGMPMNGDRTLSVELPASRLGAGDYEVLVDGHPSSGAAEPLGVWNFSISRP